ncbi:hypothetical protein [Roseomonas sp. BN140053]|uniref:hypothetical protein n=1 Tax=Roseomonas sp. BN140053 TaxID=3391898 RepID=UPI0039E946C2
MAPEHREQPARPPRRATGIVAIAPADRAKYWAEDQPAVILDVAPRFIQSGCVTTVWNRQVEIRSNDRFSWRPSRRKPNMAEITEHLAEFPGFAVRYDLSANPFFKPIVLENLRKLQTVELGKTLLRRIGRAAPRQRGDFPVGINVMVKPQKGKFSQAGYQFAFGQGVPNPTPAYNPTMQSDDGGTPRKCPFCVVGGSANAAVDVMAAQDGTGTVCNMLFTNTQVITSKGEATQPFLVLAHELIHSYHCLYGVRAPDGDDEELKTTGVGRWAGTKHVTENHFRKQFGIKLRVDY